MAPDLASVRKETLVRPVRARGPRTVAVPEVDREVAVRKVEPDGSVPGGDPEKFCEELPSVSVASRERTDFVTVRSQLLYADVLKHSRREDGVEEPVRKRKRTPVGDEELVAGAPLAPLPLPESRGIIAPRFEAGRIQKVHGDAVAAAAVEDSPRPPPPRRAASSLGR
jgi:hypothetical protein